MLGLARLAAAALAASAYVRPCAAQTAGTYTDPDTGIVFQTWTYTSPSEFTFGMALPEDALTVDATEYIGLLQCPISSGWCGMSHGQSGQMTQALLLMAWPWTSGEEPEVLTSFRFATGYVAPEVYSGDAALTQISSRVTDDIYEVLYRCQGCFSWDHEGATGSVSTTDGMLVVGWAAASDAVENPECPAEIGFIQHDNGFGQWGAQLDDVPQPSYTEWAALATATVTGDCGGETGEPTPEPTDLPACDADMVSQTWDYVVVGAGAGGITVADKLSESGASVLLLEKGPPSTGEWGGDMGPEWLDGTGLTRFDVPGLCNQIWVDSAGVACTDTDQMSGCVLGGGTAVNAGLFIKPPAEDWDENFSGVEGWSSSDMTSATNRVFSRVPGTTRPSQDGELYIREGFDVLSAALRDGGGWDFYEDPNGVPEAKNKALGYAPFMFIGGERGGPLATYLATAAARDNFALATDMSARRAIRDGATVTGVELDCLTTGGNGTTLGVVEVTPGTGRVIFAAGTFGSAKMLMRSGIGPADQLEIVAGSDDGPTMISEDQWIELPVGENLVDHVNTDTFITHPDVVFYDFYEAWDDPIEADKNLYLDERSGILAQAAPNIGPIFWDQIVGSDGNTRQLQWTARIEGNETTGTTNTMIMSQYLGRGTTSRGKMSITSSLSTIVSTAPYLRTTEDVEAVVAGIENVITALNAWSAPKAANLTIAVPDPETETPAEYVDSLAVTAAARRSNHWLGTAKMGTASDADAVVDADTRVLGVDNLFVVDGSFFPGMVTGNPTAAIMIAAERAAERILALDAAAVKSKRGEKAREFRG